MTSRILDYLLQRAWALEEGVLGSLVAVVLRHERGEHVPAEQIAAIVAAREEPRGAAQRPYAVIDGVAVLPMKGVLAHYSNQVNGSSQPRGTSTEYLRSALHAAVADHSVQSILLDVNSPGGSVDGIAETASLVRSINASKKPVDVFAEGTMASAAYWIGAQARKVYASPGTRIGSIGVYTTVVDSAAHAKSKGLKVHLVSSGGVKGGGTPGVAVAPEVLDAVRRMIDSYATLFHSNVATGRGMSVEDVRAVGTGETHLAADAERLRLIDGVMTWEEVIPTLVRDRNPAKAKGEAMRQQVESGGQQGSPAATALADMTAAASADRKPVGLDHSGTWRSTAAAAGTQKGWEEEWAASADLQSEFHTPAVYVAFMKAEAKGLVNIWKNKREE